MLEAQVNEVLKSSKFWDTWYPAKRKGDTAVGKAFEDALGIVENNIPVADLGNLEIKAKRVQSGAPLTLFTKKPSTPSKAVHLLVDRFGYSPDEHGNKRFYTAFAVDRRTKYGDGLLTLDLTDNAVRLLNQNEDEMLAVWNNEDILPIIERKLKNLVLVNAETRVVDGREEFKVKRCAAFFGTNMDLVRKAVSNKTISVHFRASGNINRVRDHGCAFRIDLRNMNKLYPISFAITP